MEWDDLMAFRVIAEELSIAGAARRLGLSAPSLSARLARLERSTAVRLVHRTTRRAELTPAGSYLLERAVQLERMWLETQGGLAEFAGGAGPRLVRAGLVDLRPRHVRPAIERALAGSRVEARVFASGVRAVAALRQDRVDLLVGYAHPNLDWHLAEGVPRAVVVRERLWVALPETHRLAAAPVVALAELAEDSWIARLEPEVRRSVDAMCERAGFRPRYTHATSNTADIGELIAAGLAVNTSSPCWSLPAGVVLRPLADEVEGTILLLWHPDRVAGADAERVVGQLRDWYSELAARSNPQWWAYVRAHPELLPGAGTDTDGGEERAPHPRPRSA